DSRAQIPRSLVPPIRSRSGSALAREPLDDRSTRVGMTKASRSDSRRRGDTDEEATMKASANHSLRATIVLIRWVLIIACSYLILFSDGANAVGLGPLVIVLFLASNLLVGRMPEERFATREFKLGVAALDTMFIAASLYI